MPTSSGSLMAKATSRAKVSAGAPIRDNSFAMIDAAVSGLGIAFVPRDIVATRIESGVLELVLDDWSPLFDGDFLYYPSGRQNLPGVPARCGRAAASKRVGATNRERLARMTLRSGRKHSHCT